MTSKDVQIVTIATEKPTHAVALPPWFAIRVRSNFEQRVADSLDSLGYQQYLPTYDSERRWSDRIKVIQQPLFPGYVFCRLDLSNRSAPVVQVPGVVDIVRLGNVAVPIRDEEIAAVERLQRSGLALGRWPFLSPGEWVVLERGPLTGMEGLLVSVKDASRLVVSIAILQRSVAVEIDRQWVRPIQRPAGHFPC